MKRTGTLFEKNDFHNEATRQNHPETWRNPVFDQPAATAVSFSKFLQTILRFSRSFRENSRLQKDL